MPFEPRSVCSAWRSSSSPMWPDDPSLPDRGRLRRRNSENVEVRWFAWREVQEALAHARAGGIALHHFRYDLRRFGLGLRDPACHIITADRALLAAFITGFGLPDAFLKPPRPHRPDIWHFDAFGWALTL